jgi:hypothetical protein
LTTDELNAGAVPDVLLAGGVGEALAEGEVRGGLNGRHDDCHMLEPGQIVRSRGALTGKGAQDGGELNHGCDCKAPAGGVGCFEVRRDVCRLATGIKERKKPEKRGTPGP